MNQWDLDLTFGRNYNGSVLNDAIWADKDDVGRTNVSPSHPLFGDQSHQKRSMRASRICAAIPVSASASSATSSPRSGQNA